MTLDSENGLFKMYVYVFGTLESSGRRWQKQRGSISHNVHISVAIAFLESLQGSQGWEMHTRPQHISVNGDCNPQFSQWTNYLQNHSFWWNFLLFDFSYFRFISTRLVPFSVVFLQKSDFVGPKVQCEYSSQPPDQFNFQ